MAYGMECKSHSQGPLFIRPNFFCVRFSCRFNFRFVFCSVCFVGVPGLCWSSLYFHPKANFLSDPKCSFSFARYAAARLWVLLSRNVKARRAERPPSFHHDACALVSVAASSLSSLITGGAPRREKVTKPETAKIQAITARFRLIGGSTLPAAEGTVHAPYTCWLSQTRP